MVCVETLVSVIIDTEATRVDAEVHSLCLTTLNTLVGLEERRLFPLLPHPRFVDKLLGNRVG